MPKALVVGNGKLLVNVGNNLLMSDFYFPHVGMEDHTTYKNQHRIGIYVDGKFSWLGGEDWEQKVEYHQDSLVGNSFATNKNLQVELNFEDLVATSSDIYMRRVTVNNLAGYAREIKLFFHTDFHIYGDKLQDTAEYDPYLNGVIHYRKKRYFLVWGEWEQSGDGLVEFATGKSNYMGKEGTWRDAEDGKLDGNPIEQGSVDSTIAFKQAFAEKEKKVLNYYICAGFCYHDVKNLHSEVIQTTAVKIYQHTLDYWKHWSNKLNYHFAGIDNRLQTLFRRSLLIIKSQIDRGGAIIAANDSDIIKFNKDTYTYMWARDAAIAVMAMTKAQYSDTSKDFFNFCSKLLTSEGYMLHKYNPDGSLGSSWHPMFKHGEVQLPIQEDETALPIVALYDLYQNYMSLEFVYELYDNFIRKAAMFMVEFVDPELDLPLPTYDLWEEQRGVFSYTVACTYAGLLSAASLAEATAHYDDASLFTKTAEKIKKAALKYLYDEELGRFYKKIVIKEGQVVEKDATVDASLSFVWRMGLLKADDPRVISTMRAIKDQLWVKGPIGGLARYTNDYYQREFYSELHPELVGNPWIITTLWYAMWLIDLAKNREDLKEVENLLHWAADRANSAGIFPEQIDPLAGRPLSVAPLTWSHSEFVITMLKYRDKLEEIEGMEIANDDSTKLNGI